MPESIQQTAPNPAITADSRLMENYVLESPVNGGSDITTVRDVNNQLNAFTIGTNGRVYQTFPDQQSDTGWNQIDIGIKAKKIAAGLTTDNLLIVYAYNDDNGGTLLYVQQTAGGQWAAPVSLPGSFPNASIATHNFDDGFYFAYSTREMTSYSVTYNNSKPALNLTVKNPDNPGFNNLICLSWSYFAGKPSLYIASNKMVYTLTPVPAQEENSIQLISGTPDQEVQSMLAIRDAYGVECIFAILNDGYLYYLYAPPKLWEFTKRVFQDIKVSSFAVSLNSVNQPEVLAINPSGTLFHSTAHFASIPQWTTPWQIRDGAGKVAANLNSLGSSQAFVISSNSKELSYLSQDSSSTDWIQENIEMENLTTLKKISSFTMDIALLDSNGRPSPNCSFSIKSDNDCILSINGIVANLNEGIVFNWQANAQGKIFLCLETDTLSAPQFSINTEWMDAGTFEEIQPNLKVQDRLNTINVTDLLDAPGLLTGPYRTPAVADSLVKGIKDSLSLAPPNRAALTYAENFHSWQYRPTHNSYYTSSKIDPSAIPQKNWQMDFSSGVPEYKELSATEATALIVSMKSKFSEYGVNTPSGQDVSWGDIWSSIQNGLADVVSVVISAGQSYITFVLDGVTYLYNRTISFIQQVFDLIQMFFDKVKVGFQQLYELLKFVLNWTDITLTQQVISHSILQIFDTASGVLNLLKTQSGNYFDALIADWAASLRTLENSPLGENSLLQISSSAQPPVGYYTGINNNLILNAFTNHAGQGQALNLMTAANLEEFQSVAADILAKLNTYAGQFQANQNYQLAVTYFENLSRTLSSDIDQALQSLLNGLVEMLSALIQIALTLVKDIISALLDGVIALIEGIKTLITATIDIPYLKQVYKNITGTDCTMLNIMSLMLAIPTTIIYKIKKGEPPFADQAAVFLFNNTLTAANILAAIGINPPSGPNSVALNPFQTFMKEHIAYFSLTNMVSFWALGITKISTDLATPAEASEPKTFVWSIASIIISGATIATSCPWYYSDVPPGFGSADAANNTSWFFLYAPLLEDIVAVAVQRRRLALIELGGPVLSTITGTGLIVLFAIVSNKQANENKYSHALTGANMLSAIPSVFSSLRLIPEPYARVSKLALAIVDGGCYLAAGILYRVAADESGGVDRKEIVRQSGQILPAEV